MYLHVSQDPATDDGTPGVVHPLTGCNHVVNSIMANQIELGDARPDFSLMVMRSKYFRSRLASIASLCFVTNCFGLGEKLPEKHFKPDNDLDDNLMGDQESFLKTLHDPEANGINYIGFKRAYYKTLKAVDGIMMRDVGKEVCPLIVDLFATPKTVFTRITAIIKCIKGGIYGNFKDYYEAVRSGKKGILVTEFVAIYPFIAGTIAQRKSAININSCFVGNAGKILRDLVTVLGLNKKSNYPIHMFGNQILKILPDQVTNSVVKQA